MLKRSQVQAQLVPQDRSVLSFGGQISDDELDKRLKLAQQISTGGSSQTLMTEAEVLEHLPGSEQGLFGRVGPRLGWKRRCARVRTSRES